MSRQHSLYWRARGGVKRAYADLRAYADVGGGREALVAPGEKLATADQATALELLTRRIKDLDGLRRGRVLHGLAGQTTLAAFAREHLMAKATEVNDKTGEPVTTTWLEGEELRLGRAVKFLGDVPLEGITTRHVQDFDRWLVEQGLSGGTRRHHLNTLSNLYRRARALHVVPSGYDPVGDLVAKPSAKKVEARWLQVHDAALLLEAARLYAPALTGRHPVPFAYALIGTFLLTGGRESEVLGLEVDDVSVDRGVVTFRPNAWRRLKTGTSHRSVPLWPQLREILGAHLAAHPPGRLLFPSYRTGQEAMLTDFRRLLDAVAGRAGWKAGEIRSKMFRHTYCAARLQTLDAGEPVSGFTVGREMGHGGDAMVRKVYGHLGQVRHRAPVVEYRADQHAIKLGDRLLAVRSVVLAPPMAPRG